MRTHFRLTAITLVILSTLAACSSIQSARHEYLMRGQVVAIAGNEAVVCVGSRDGAQADQEFTAYKLVERSVGGPARTTPQWQRVKVGTVRLTEVFDEHFAKAMVVNGSVEVNDLIELD